MSKTKTVYKLDILRTYFRDIEEGETKEAALELLKMVDSTKAENKKIIEDCRDSIGEKQEEVNRLEAENKELRRRELMVNAEGYWQENDKLKSELLEASSRIKQFRLIQKQAEEGLVELMTLDEVDDLLNYADTVLKQIRGENDSENIGSR